jgi:hypothetical protein
MPDAIGLVLEARFATIALNRSDRRASPGVVMRERD